VIPQLNSPYDRFIFWDKFGRPEVIPLRGTGPTYWWLDKSKSERLTQRRQAGGAGLLDFAGRGAAPDRQET
jgi:hypothetical protein